MPKFIEWHGDQQAPPPYEFEDVKLWSFPLRAKRDHLARVVDRFLNDPLQDDDVRYEPWKFGISNFGVVYVMVLHYGLMSSTAKGLIGQPGDPGVPDWRDRGFMNQHELCFAIPVNRWAKGVTGVFDTWEKWSFFTPYIFVDNPWSTVCGNMVLGYPKAMAEFAVDEGINALPSIKVGTHTLQPYDKDTLYAVEPLLEVQGPLIGMFTGDESWWPFGPIAAAFAENSNMPMDGSVLQQILDGMQPPTGGQIGYDIVQLKQMRDAVHADQAVYQRVHEYPVRLSSFHEAGPMAPAALRVHDTDTWPIARELGLAKNAFGWSPCLFPFRMRSDFTMEGPPQMDVMG